MIDTYMMSMNPGRFTRPHSRPDFRSEEDGGARTPVELSRSRGGCRNSFHLISFHVRAARLFAPFGRISHETFERTTDRPPARNARPAASFAERARAPSKRQGDRDGALWPPIRPRDCPGSARRPWIARPVRVRGQSRLAPMHGLLPQGDYEMGGHLYVQVESR